MEHWQSLRVEREIAAPPGRVWDLITDIASRPSTVRAVVAVERLDGGSGFVIGARWRETRRILGKQGAEEMEVTALEPGHAYTVEAENRGMHYASTFTVIPAGARSRLMIEFAGWPERAPGFFGKLVARLGMTSVRTSLERDLADIAAAAEGRAGRGSP